MCASRRVILVARVVGTGHPEVPLVRSLTSSLPRSHRRHHLRRQLYLLNKYLNTGCHRRGHRYPRTDFKRYRGRGRRRARSSYESVRGRCAYGLRRIGDTKRFQCGASGLTRKRSVVHASLRLLHPPYRRCIDESVDRFHYR